LIAEVHDRFAFFEAAQDSSLGGLCAVPGMNGDSFRFALPFGILPCDLCEQFLSLSGDGGAAPHSSYPAGISAVLSSYGETLFKLFVMN